jgi:aryl-alcohol dehydrogenase-like predicted oxidoreductase
MAKAFNLGLTAWSPLGGGLLTGKYHSKKESNARYETETSKQFLKTGERPDRIVAAVKKIGEQVGRSPAQVALAWLRYRDIPVIPILGARRISQLQDNLDSLSLELTEKQVAELNEASAVELGFPHDFYEYELVKSMIYGGMRDRIVAA